MQRSFGREVALIVFKAVVVVVTIMLIVFGIGALFEADLGISDGFCNVAVLPVEGEIWPYYGLTDAPLIVTPEAVETFLTTAESDTSIEAVLIEINSPGGTPVAAERISERLRSSTKPVVGMIGDIGASGGYMIAAATDYLVASPMSMVGGIGVTMSYLEYSQQNEDSGIEYVELNTGKFKNSGSPDKPLSDEERELFQRDLDEIHTEFVNMVALYRNLPVEKVEAIADGSTLNGIRARDAGLVDEVGGRAQVKQALATILQKDARDIIFCEYESPLLPF